VQRRAEERRNKRTHRLRDENPDQYEMARVVAWSSLTQ